MVNFDAADIEPIVTWGITPDQSVGVNDKLPEVGKFSADEVKTVELAYQHMDLKPGQPIKGTPIDVAFIGSCTNGRISDLREAAKVAKGRRVAKSVRAFVVPGSQKVKLEAEKEGLHKIFTEAGFRVARGGLFHVPGHEPRQAEGQGNFRFLVQPQFHRPPGKQGGAHHADEPRHGGRRRNRGQGGGRPRTDEIKKPHPSSRPSPSRGEGVVQSFTTGKWVDRLSPSPLEGEGWGEGCLRALIRGSSRF